MRLQFVAVIGWENCPMKHHYRKERPVDPPSVFSEASIIPAPPPPLRTTLLIHHATSATELDGST